MKSPTTAPAGLVRLLAALRQAEVALTAGAFAVLVTVIFADVAWRRLSGSGLLWAREVGVFANIVLTILGIGIASADGAHLRPKFLDRLLPARWEPVLVRVQEGLTAVGFALLAWLALRVLGETIDLEERSIVLRWLLWPVQMVLPVAFLAGTLRHGLFAAWPTLRPVERGEGSVEVPAS